MRVFIYTLIHSTRCPKLCAISDHVEASKHVTRRAMSHGRFYTYRLPTVTVLSQLKVVEFMRKTRPDIPIVELSPSADSEEAIKKSLNEAEIVFGDPELIAPYWSDLKNVRWMQSTWAGNDALFRALTPPGSKKATPPPFTGKSMLIDEFARRRRKRRRCLQDKVDTQ